MTYFGLSYNAGDINNGFTFFDTSGISLGRYSTATLVAKLNGGKGTLTALDGSVYNTSAYYGQPNGNGPSAPNSGRDSSEPFAFLNFFTTVGTTIRSIVFDNAGSMGTGFETDNHTISASSSNAPPTTGGFIGVGSASAPDASSAALLLGGLPLGGLVILRRRRHSLR